MKEENYRLIGRACIAIPLVAALGWCVNQSGLTGWLIRTSRQLLGTPLIQVSWLLTIAILGLPGYYMKRFFDDLAWREHVRSLPPPDVQSSAKRSKYLQAEVAPRVPATPKPVEIRDIPEEQEEFIATCSACGHLFPARKSDKDVKCPQCGEALPLQT